MQAIVCEAYGTPEVLQLREVDRPTPKEGEVLVRVHAAALNQGDWYAMTGTPFLVVRLAGGALRKPKQAILGSDMAGRVVAVGPGVERLKAGDEVFGDLCWCGMGAFAEYVSVPERLLALKPANVSFEQAAAAPVAAVVALQGLRDVGQVQPRQQVLINGASGGVGTFALQIAKAYGAVVTAVCSTRNVEMAASLADHVIDYTRVDFAQTGQRYDLILGVNGHRSLSDYGRALKPQGTYICTGGTMAQIFGAMLKGPLMSRKGGQQFKSLGSVKQSQQDLVTVGGMLCSGQIVSVIDKRYTLAEVPEAFRYLHGHARGKVVINVVPES